MKVLLVNGSPNKGGCTYTALTEVANMLNTNGVETEHFWIGNKPVMSCTGCCKCATKGKCVYSDVVNEFLEKIDKYDGFVFGYPVHFASATGAMTSFMDRTFFVAARFQERFLGKPGVNIVSCRRAGSTAALDQLNKYITYAGMPLVPSRYWNMVHGNTPDEVRQDLEGMLIMRAVGQNMAWLLKCIEAGKENGIAFPILEEV